jgi:4-aminobutyrate aminotransferase-like enzyme
MIFKRAKGALIWDADGKEYIDCTSQAWSNNIGANDERVLAAAWEQMQDLTHLRSNYDSVPLLLLSKNGLNRLQGKLKEVGDCLHGSLAVEDGSEKCGQKSTQFSPILTLYVGYHADPGTMG